MIMIQSKKQNIVAQTLLCAALVLTSLSSCCGSKSTGEELSYPEQVKAYYDKDSVLPGATASTVAYFDLSDGIVVAYKSNASCADFLNRITQRIITGEESQVYALANDEITPLEMKQTALYNKIMDASSYRQHMAPIEKTLEKIVTDGRTAVLVTDFEEYTPDKRVQHAAFATRYFTKWLREQGDITFFVFNYVERRLPKHLYFIVFDNKEHQLLSQIQAATDGVYGFETFHLSRDAYSYTTEYPSATKGGNYHSADAGGLDIVTAVLEDGDAESYTNLDGAVEFYPIGETWANAIKNAAACRQPGVKPLYTDILRNLFFDFSDTDSYMIDQLAVRVTDVEDDFCQFEECRLADTATDPENDAHYDANGNKLPEYDYAKNPGKTFEVKDMLVLDQELFQTSLQESARKKVEVGIDFSPNFGGAIIGGDDADLLRVDVVIAKARPNLSARIDDLFLWNGNNNLRDAIRNTLQELNPEGDIIYTYYLKPMN